MISANEPKVVFINGNTGQDSTRKYFECGYKKREGLMNHLN